MKRTLKFLAAVLLLGFIVIQLFQPLKTNPPVTADIAAPPEVKAILKRSCYDCHSHETVWPWYASVAPASWVVVEDVLEGRRNLNFSTWDKYTGAKQAKLLREIVKEVEEGAMPLGKYTFLHPGAKLTRSDIAVLRGWAGNPPAERGEKGETD